MKSRSQIKRFRSQIECTHDDDDREIAIMADGMCPLCMKKRIEELEAKLARHDMSKNEVVNKQYLKQIEQMAMDNDPKQYQKQINELSVLVTKLRDELESERRKYSTDGSEVLCRFREV